VSARDDPVAVARDLLDRLQSAVSTADLEASVALFVSNPSLILVGSEAGEGAIGARELDAFFRHLYARPISFGWEWPKPIEARAHSGVVWFLADGEVVERTDGGEHRTPYRFTGVAVKAESTWCLAMLHGSEPATPK
jgi:hypothetical protein